MSLFDRIEINRRDRLLKAYLKRLGKTATPEQQAAITCMLEHDECFEAFAAGVESDYDARPAPFWGGNEVGTPLTDFLAWLLAHSDELMALILKIIDLFTKPAPAQ